jgi:hypothetical protein
MKKIVSVLIVIVALSVVACKKKGFGPLTDSRPSIPVNVSNAVDFRPGPTVSASRAANSFSIELEIPASSGKTIKEITKVAATGGSSAPLFGTVVGPTGLYTAAVITGTNSNKIIFNTSLTEYTSRTGVAVPANNPPTNGVELTRQFYFLITLNDGQTIITQQVRVLVIP